MPAKFMPCESHKATHVRLINACHTSLINGGIYEYHYDPDPREETYFIVGEDGIPFYDFECVIRCEYLKEIKEA